MTPPFDGPMAFRVQLGWEEWMAGQIRLLGRPWGSQEELAPRLTAPRTAKARAEERPVPSRFSEMPVAGPLPRSGERETLPIDATWYPIAVAMVEPPFALPLRRATLSYGPDPTRKEPAAPPSSPEPTQRPSRVPEQSLQPVAPPVAPAADVAESVATFFVIPTEPLPVPVQAGPVQVDWPSAAKEPEPPPAPVSMPPRLDVVVNPTVAVEDELPLQEENASAVERAVGMLPLWAWMALVAGLMLVGGYFFLPWQQWAGTAAAAETGPSGAPLSAGLPAGPEWKTKAAEDVRGITQGRQLAVYVPAPTLRDFRLETVAAVQERGMGWAFRVVNARNYHLLRLERGPKLMLTRLVVANGRETGHEKLALPPALDAGRPFTVVVEARGHRFLAQINNVVAGEWTDSRFPAGAIAVVSETGDRFAVQNVVVREGASRR